MVTVYWPAVVPVVIVIQSVLSTVLFTFSSVVVSPS